MFANHFDRQTASLGFGDRQIRSDFDRVIFETEWDFIVFISKGKSLICVMGPDILDR